VGEPQQLTCPQAGRKNGIPGLLRQWRWPCRPPEVPGSAIMAGSVPRGSTWLDIERLQARLQETKALVRMSREARARARATHQAGCRAVPAVGNAGPATRRVMLTWLRGRPQHPGHGPLPVQQHQAPAPLPQRLSALAPTWADSAGAW
jgi:hypothetical protein